MADKTVLRCAALGVAVDAEAHVDFMHWDNPVHRFDGSVALLTSDSCPDMGFVHEFDKIGKRIDPIPANLEGRLMIIRPRLGDRLDPAQQAAAVASDASRNWRHSGGRRTPGVLVTVLTRNFIDTGVHPMAEWNRLLDAGSWRPRALRKGHGDRSAKKEHQGHRNQDAVHRSQGLHHRYASQPSHPRPAHDRVRTHK